MIIEEFWKNNPLRTDRDIILMDQRGTGASGANCIEMGGTIFAVLRRDLDAEMNQGLLTPSLKNVTRQLIKKELIWQGILVNKMQRILKTYA
ncbi:hypothetical protein DHD05_21350 [Arenibacter sp. N53]|nr:hypothetical protein [Arenibacter sp. N53]